MSTAMTISKAIPFRARGRARDRWHAVRPVVLPTFLLAVGFTPLLVVRGLLLLDRPHLSAFPLTLVAGTVLAWKGTRGLGALEPGSRERSLTAVGVALALLIFAGFTAWAWLGTATAMLTLLAIAYGLGGAILMRAVLPVWGFVALAVLTPVGVEEWLITRLQALVTLWASPVLDALGVLHLTEGNVIRITSRPLFVERACSGVSSLFVAIEATLFGIVWTRRKPISATVLFLAATCWVVLGNIVRVVAIVVAADRWNVDLASGWRHELWGFLIFAAVLGLTVSTDRLLQFLEVVRTFRFFWPGYYCDPYAIQAGTSRVVMLLPPTQFADIGRTWLASGRVAAVFAVVGLLQLFWLWPLLARAVPATTGSMSLRPMVVMLNSLGENDVPDRMGPYCRERFETKTRLAEDSFGEFSREWHYGSNALTATAVVDFPFRGWHELTKCYRAIGWTLTERIVRDGKGPDAQSAGACVEATFKRPPGRYASLIFGLDDDHGNELEPAPMSTGLPVGHYTDIFRYARDRFSAQADLSDMSLTLGYQVQLLIVTYAPLTPAQWTEARAIFASVRRSLKNQVAGRARTVSSGVTHDH